MSKEEGPEVIVKDIKSSRISYASICAPKIPQKVVLAAPLVEEVLIFKTLGL
jgi:hypothetical protein